MCLGGSASPLSCALRLPLSLPAPRGVVSLRIPVWHREGLGPKPTGPGHTFVHTPADRRTYLHVRASDMLYWSLCRHTRVHTVIGHKYICV